MSKELEGIMSKESKAEKMQIDTTLGQLPQKEKGSLQPIECKTIEEQRRFNSRDWQVDLGCLHILVLMKDLRDTLL